MNYIGFDDETWDDGTPMSDAKRRALRAGFVVDYIRDYTIKCVGWSAAALALVIVGLVTKIIVPIPAAS